MLMRAAAMGQGALAACQEELREEQEARAQVQRELEGVRESAAAAEAASEEVTERLNAAWRSACASRCLLPFRLPAGDMQKMWHLVGVPPLLWVCRKAGR